MEAFKKISKDLSILFLYSENDCIVSREEIFEFYKSFKGEKEMMEIEEKHEEERSEMVFGRGLEWIRGRKMKKKKSKLQLSCSYGNDGGKHIIKEVSFRFENSFSK